MRSSAGSAYCLVLSLIGIAVCASLTVLHVGLLRGEVLGGIVCGAGGTFDCHAVTASRWGALLGMPLSLWGLLGYLAAWQLALVAWVFPDARTNALLLLAGLSAAFVAVDLALAGVMAVLIRHLCLLCFATYLVNFLLLLCAKRAVGLSWADIPRQLPGACGALAPWKRQPLGAAFAGTMLLMALGVAGFHAATVFFSRPDPVALRAQLREYIRQQSPVVPALADDPARGSTDAALQVVEFSDFLCPVCHRAARFNEIMLTNHRGHVRLVFKQFPLDTACNSTVERMVHPGACAVAAASECAQRQGKFWPFHDRILRVGHAYAPKRLSEDARRLGLDLARFEACLTSGEGMDAVKGDIAEGQRLGITSTPTYLINGYRMSGLLTPHILNELLAVLREQQR